MQISNRAMALVVALVLGLTLTVAPSVYASHNAVLAQFKVFRGDTEVSFQWTGIQCSEILCQTTIDGTDAGTAIARRDVGFFERWCGGNPISVVIVAGESDATFTCDGPGPWRIEGLVGLRDGTNVFTAYRTHESDVTVEVSVQ